jgi:hypothetical protein
MKCDEPVIAKIKQAGTLASARVLEIRSDAEDRENVMDISDIADYASGSGYQASSHETVAGGTPYELQVVTNSTAISDFSFSEESRQRYRSGSRGRREPWAALA